MSRARAAALACAAAALLGACHSKVMTTTLGHVGIDARTTTLAPGDSVTVRAGIRYNDGHFVQLAGSFVSHNLNVITVEAQSGLVRGIAPGSTELEVTVPGARFDTLFTVAATGAQALR